MRAVVQRVTSASVEVGGLTRAEVGQGYLVYLGIEREDTNAMAAVLAEKVRYLRVFEDAEGKLNRDVAQAGGSVLVVSAFTVCADARQGRRPSFTEAAPAEAARPLYEEFCGRLSALGVTIAQGVFQGDMQVRSVNDGPVCILLDTHKRF